MAHCMPELSTYVRMRLVNEYVRRRRRRSHMRMWPVEEHLIDWSTHRLNGHTAWPPPYSTDGDDSLLLNWLPQEISYDVILIGGLRMLHRSAFYQ